MPSYTYKISQLPSAASLNNSSILPIVDGTITKKVTAQQVLNFITSSTFSNLNVLNLTGSSITGSLARFTILTGSTTTGSLALFTTVSGTTIAGSTALFVSTTSSQAMITGDLRVLGTASITQLNTLNQTSLFIGDKYITILSGGIDHTGINGAGILWGTSSGPGETTGSLGEHAHILYNATSDGLQLFPALTVSGANNTILFNVSGATSYFSGVVGIGTTSPTQTLSVTGTLGVSGDTIISGDLSVSSNTGSLNLRKGTTNTIEAHIRPEAGKKGYLSFTENTVADRWIVGIENGDDALLFKAGSVVTNTERMRITGNGNVGIGTSNPSNKLHVKSSGEIVSFETTSGTGNNYLRFKNGASNLGYFGWGSSVNNHLNISNESTGDINFFAGGSERLRISGSNGNVGIGTTSPATKLDVNGSVRVTGGSIYGQVAEITASVSTTYTLQSSDSGKLLTINNGSPVTLTVPAGLPTGFTVSISQLGTGQITVTPSGTTINNRQSHTKSAGQFAIISIVGTSANTYIFGGDTAA